MGSSRSAGCCRSPPRPTMRISPGAPIRPDCRRGRDDALKPEVQRLFEENFGVYGVRKVCRQLKREGHDVARCTVARLMQTTGSQGVIRGRPFRTTIIDKARRARWITSIGSSRPRTLMRCGSPTSPMSRPGRAYVAFVIGRFKRSCNTVCGLIEGTGQAPLRGFAKQVSCEARR